VSFDGLLDSWTLTGFAENRTLNPSSGLFSVIPDPSIKVGEVSNIARTATSNDIKTIDTIIEVTRIFFGRFAFLIRASIYSSL